MTTQTSAAPTSVPARAAAAARPKASKAPTAIVPDQHDMTGAWILSAVIVLMGLTIAAALYVAHQMQL